MSNATESMPTTVNPERNADPERNLSSERDLNPAHALTESATDVATTAILARQLDAILLDNRALTSELYILRAENDGLKVHNSWLIQENDRLRAAEAAANARYRDCVVEKNAVILGLEEDIMQMEEGIRGLRNEVRHYQRRANVADGDLESAEDAYDQLLWERDFHYQEVQALERRLRALQTQVPEEARPMVEAAIQAHALFRFTETGGDDTSSVSNDAPVEADDQASSISNEALNVSGDRVGDEAVSISNETLVERDGNASSIANQASAKSDNESDGQSDDQIYSDARHGAHDEGNDQADQPGQERVTAAIARNRVPMAQRSAQEFIRYVQEHLPEHLPERLAPPPHRS